MTNEEKAKEYAIKITDELRNKGFLTNEEINQRYAGIVQGVLYGLAKGRKEAYELYDTEVNDMAKDYEERLKKLEKENKELKEQIKEREKLIEIQYAENQTLGNNNATLIHRVGELSEQVEKMKCCGKLKWHDLRKNPNDLPKDSEDDECYLVAFRNFHNPEETVTRAFYYNGREFVEEDYDEIPYFKKEGVLVGWCELPKFEE